MKNSLRNRWIKRAALVPILVLSASVLHAQTTNYFSNVVVSNSLTVLSNSDTYGMIGFGVTTSSIAAQQFSYTDANHTATWIAAQSNSLFLWQENNVGTPKNKLLLDGSNNLTLYGTNGSSVIILNPNANGGILLSNANAGITFADGTSMRSAGSGVVTIGTNGSISSGTAVLTSASGQYSISVGVIDTASGNFSAAFGLANTASGSNSTVFGVGNNASGYSSLADGSSNRASATASIAFGVGTKASAYASLALGYFNVGLVSTNNGATSWVPTDPILEIGNGTNGVTTTNWWGGVTVTQFPSDAVTIFKNGNIRNVGNVETMGSFRMPQAGDMSMGSFTNGNSPKNLIPTNGLTYPGGT